MHKTSLNVIKLMGFSLIEILITITIVIILSTVSVYSYKDYKMSAMFNSALAIIEQNKLIISEYYSKNKVCPPQNFINVTPNNPSSALWSRITNTNCAISLFETLPAGSSTAPGLILTFNAVITGLGYLSYYCSDRGANYVTEVKNYVPACSQTSLTTPDGTAPNT